VISHEHYDHCDLEAFSRCPGKHGVYEVTYVISDGGGTRMAHTGRLISTFGGIPAMPDVKPLPRWFRAGNHAVRAMSRIGLTMGPVCVLTVPGRHTGKPRSTPVSPLTVNGGRYVVAGLPDSGWARNVRAAGHARLSRGRRHEPVTLTEVTDSTLPPAR
jgi:deazaflavin-dependent oxidoreductase (nitroreductase family)